MIKSVLLTEWLKLRHYKPFWVMTALYAVCLGGMVAVALLLYDWVVHQPKFPPELAKFPPFQYPHAWQTVAYMASFLQFLPALLVILTVTNEFTFRTHRQNLLDGWSRPQFLAAKGAVALGLTLYCAAVVGVLSVLAATWQGHAPSPQGLEYLGYFTLQTAVYTGLALLLGCWIRRAALALGAFLVYSVALERILAIIASFKVSGLGDFLPLQAAQTLVPFPFLKEATGDRIYTHPPEMLAAAAGLYLLLFAGLIWIRFRREDL